jgi:transcriptional regulator with XRE-family HTH domain
VQILAHRIRLRRLALGLRQADLAAALHTSPQSVSKWERGANDPDLIHLPGLARLLQVTVDWLLNVEGAAHDVQGSIVCIGVTAARLRGTQLSPAAFMAWCQAVLDRSTACVEEAQGHAITARGPGLLAVFTGEDHQLRAWQAVRRCCQVHEVPIKIGCAGGTIHQGELRLGAQRQVSDVFGEPVTVALRLSDWIATQGPASRSARHAVAWRGAWPTGPLSGIRHHPRLTLDDLILSAVHSTFVLPGRRP